MQFYVLERTAIGSSDDKQWGTDALQAPGFETGDAPRCETCGDVIGMRRWLPPYQIELETWGREYGDIVFVIEDLIVSQRFRQLWIDHHLIGLAEFNPVEIVKVKRHRNTQGDPPLYYRAVVTRSRTAIDLEASEFEWEEPPTCPTCLLADNVKRWKRIVIDPNTWESEDIFIPRGSGSTLVTSERFKEMVAANGIKNCELTPAERYEYDFYPWEREAGPAPHKRPRPSSE